MGFRTPFLTSGLRAGLSQPHQPWPCRNRKWGPLLNWQKTSFQNCPAQISELKTDIMLNLILWCVLYKKDS